MLVEAANAMPSRCERMVGRQRSSHGRTRHEQLPLATGPWHLCFTAAAGPKHTGCQRPRVNGTRAQMFPLPSQPARGAILGIHTRRWNPPPRAELLAELAQRCVGFCGADLKVPPARHRPCGKSWLRGASC